jgi:hypothetical protein
VRLARTTALFAGGWRVSRTVCIPILWRVAKVVHVGQLRCGCVEKWLRSRRESKESGVENWEEFEWQDSLCRADIMCKELAQSECHVAWPRKTQKRPSIFASEMLAYESYCWPQGL